MIPSGYLCLNRATTSGSNRWIPSSWFPRVILKQGEKWSKPKILELKCLILLKDAYLLLILPIISLNIHANYFKKTLILD
uniref:Uncharacterized protein n=1 Tax=Rhinolophus ferrumequinum TaxID=59479 RepID=A0A671G0P5_RHIFE